MWLEFRVSHNSVVGKFVLEEYDAASLPNGSQMSRRDVLLSSRVHNLELKTVSSKRREPIKQWRGVAIPYTSESSSSAVFSMFVVISLYLLQYCSCLFVSLLHAHLQSLAQYALIWTCLKIRVRKNTKHVSQDSQPPRLNAECSIIQTEKFIIRLVRLVLLLRQNVQSGLPG